MNLCAEQKQTYRLWKQTYVYQRGNVGTGKKKKLITGFKNNPLELTATSIFFEKKKTYFILWIKNS